MKAVRIRGAGAAVSLPFKARGRASAVRMAWAVLCRRAGIRLRPRVLFPLAIVAGLQIRHDVAKAGLDPAEQ